MAGPRWLRRRWLLAVLAAGAGCALSPPGPRGPLRGPSLDWGYDWSFAYGRGDATLASGATQSGGADSLISPLALIPRRFELRLAPLDWMDVGLEYGLSGGSVEARIGQPARDGDQAWNFALGYQTGNIGLFRDTKPVQTAWVRAEAYPLFPEGWWPGARLVLSLGLDHGLFFHELDAPTAANVDPSVGTRIDLIRRETRLEGAFGFFATYPRGAALVAIEPYAALLAGTSIPDGCSGCDALASYHQSWGAVLVIRLIAHTAL